MANKESVKVPTGMILLTRQEYQEIVKEKHASAALIEAYVSNAKRGHFPFGRIAELEDRIKGFMGPSDKKGA